VVRPGRGGFSFRPRRGTDEDEIVVDLTPMIDITFLLLIFFVVTAQFTHRGLEIDRPESPVGTSIRQQNLTIQIDREGRVFFEGQEVTLGLLESSLSRRLVESGQSVVTIDADRAARHGRVVEVMGHCKRAGATSIRVPTIIKPTLP
jgi:biopolymer transport protein ExbD